MIGKMLGCMNHDEVIKLKYEANHFYSRISQDVPSKHLGHRQL